MAGLKPAPLFPCPPLPANATGAAPPAIVRAFWLRTNDGLRLRAALWSPDKPRATLLLFPGRTEYVEQYHPVAALMAAAGLAVLAIDWRGQGASDRLIDNVVAGHVTDFASYQRDVAALVAAAADLDLPQPWHLLAHSMGGTIGLRALHEGLEVKSVSLSAPMWGIAIGSLPDALGHPLARLISGGACLLGLGTRQLPRSATPDDAPPDMVFASNRLTSDRGWWEWMNGLNAALPDLVIDAPSFAWARAAMIECRALMRMPMPDLPALISLSDGESIVSATAIRAGVARWPGARLLPLPDARHEAMFEHPAARDAFLAATEAMISAV